MTPYSEDGYLALGSLIFAPTIFLRTTESGSSTGVTEIPPQITIITSLAYDLNRDAFLAFHFGGIALISNTDTLQIIENHPGVELGTAQHGCIKIYDNSYYTFGATVGDFDERDLVVNKFDASFQIVSRDSIGVLHAADYPFINQSLTMNDSLLWVGGHFASPLELGSEKDLSFFIAQYDHAIDQGIWG